MNVHLRAYTLNNCITEKYNLSGDAGICDEAEKARFQRL